MSECFTAHAHISFYRGLKEGLRAITAGRVALRGRREAMLLLSAGDSAVTR
jgi:hypothetical protein